MSPSIFCKGEQRWGMIIQPYFQKEWQNHKEGVSKEGVSFYGLFLNQTVSMRRNIFICLSLKALSLCI